MVKFKLFLFRCFVMFCAGCCNPLPTFCIQDIDALAIENCKKNIRRSFDDLFWYVYRRGYFGIKCEDRFIDYKKMDVVYTAIPRIIFFNNEQGKLDVKLSSFTDMPDISGRNPKHYKTMFNKIFQAIKMSKFTLIAYDGAYLFESKLKINSSFVKCIIKYIPESNIQKEVVYIDFKGE